jgi:hypothetical protein
MKVRVGVVLGLAAVAAAVLLGSASPGNAAGGMSIVLTPLIGTSANEVPQVTFDGKIGYHLEVTNTGTATVNHLVIVVDSDSATFSDASQAACSRDPADATRMVCSLRQMPGGAPPFSVDLRFNAPSTGSSVVSTPSVTVDAQTQGGSGNNGTTTTTGASVTSALVSSAANSLVKTFAKNKETVATSASLPQHSSFVLPNSFFVAVYGIEMSVQETTGTPLCDKCPSFVTDLQIPASLGANSPFSPTNPFSFTITLLAAGRPSGYQPTGLYHDGVLVPMCSVSPLGPTTHMCLNSFDPGKGNDKSVVAKGIADQNGKNGFG